MVVRAAFCVSQAALPASATETLPPSKTKPVALNEPPLTELVSVPPESVSSPTEGEWPAVSRVPGPETNTALPAGKAPLAPSCSVPAATIVPAL